MKIGIFSRTYETSNLEETCAKMTAQGIFHTQFNLSNAGMNTLPDTYDEAYLNKIKETVRRYGIHLDALSGTFNMIDPDEAQREKGCRQFQVQCEIARILEIPIVSLCTGSKNRESKWKWHEDNAGEKAWTDLLRTTERILPYAQKEGIILGVETEASNIVNTPEKARCYLDIMESENLKIIMDGANLFLPSQVSNMKQVLEDAFSILGQDIVLAHGKDFSFDGDLEFVAAGEGILDFSLYLKLLKQYDYRGTLVMHGLSEQQVPKSRDFLKGILEHE